MIPEPIFEDLQHWAEAYLGPHCLEQCTDHCCRNIEIEEGSLYLFVSGLNKGDPIPQDQFMPTVVPGRSVETIFDEGVRSYVLFDQCIFRTDEGCAIHDESDRPRICKEHPFYLNGHLLTFKQGCHYISQSRPSNEALEALFAITEKHGLELHL